MPTQTLKGFRDFLPPEARARQWLKSQMVRVFEKWGYEPLETPTLESAALFSGQVGEDEQLFYQFLDRGNREVMLRYDQTVPTCRVIGQYYNQITFPFRRYQIQSAFRAEKPQSGRYREFTQSDLDIFGLASPTADAEIIAVTLDLYRTLGFKQVVAAINDRDLMTGIPYPAIAAIDKIKKIGDEGVIAEMIKKGITDSEALNYLERVKSLSPSENLKTIFQYLADSGFDSSWYRFEPALARSFSYSQGPIWEIIIPEYGSGSVGGGERYDKLVERISGFSVPGTGIGIGFDRTLEAAGACGLIPNLLLSPTQVLVTVFSPELFPNSLKLAAALRSTGIFIEVYPDSSVKLEKQLKYASKKGIPFVVVLGPEEVANNTVNLKNMSAKSQITLPQSDLAGRLQTTNIQ